MKLLQVTILCLLSCLYSSDNTANLSSATVNAANTSELTPKTTSFPSPVMTPVVGISPKGTTTKESLKTPPLSTVLSLTTVTGEGTTTNGVMKEEFTNTGATVTNISLPNAVSTFQSSQHKTENQSSTKTTERPVNTLPPNASPSNTSILPSKTISIPENISQSQGTENAKNASSSSASPSYSSIILPVVIVLIVITLSVFVLVGLYRMCWKTDPGTPENGNDQPQSDKESVKLLTVKTISHEPGEHSAQGKTKN
ncbi:endomucin isoform X1 [Manis javanica]|uniref:endomucin isoform X1 n=2 Tax=Manis javanica TaxID=9974 RepID=UPI001879EADA|nr:endomucin isoform X1 [Manis javanica]KAI5937813.1 Endomucin [Manis javanica]